MSDTTFWIDNETALKAERLNSLEQRANDALANSNSALQAAQNANANLQQVIDLGGAKGDPGENGADGDNGMDGRGLRWRGNWQPNTEYDQNDAVHSPAGGSYIAPYPIDGSANFDPADGWELMAEPGAQGEEGVQGPPGDPAYTLQIGVVTTLPSGSEPTAEIRDVPGEPGTVEHFLDLGLVAGGSEGGGDGDGAANLGGMYGTMALLMNEEWRQLGNLRIADDTNAAAADPSTPAVGLAQTRFFGQVGQSFEASTSSIFGLYNFTAYPSDLTYTASDTYWDETYDALPAGLTLAADGTISGTPTADTMSKPARASSTWITQASANADAQRTALIEFVIFPAS